MRARDGGGSAHSTAPRPAVAAPAAAPGPRSVSPGHRLTVPVVLSAGEVQAFYEDLSGRQYVNEIFNFSVDKLYHLLFTDSPFQRDFMEQRRFSGAPPGWSWHRPPATTHFPLFQAPPPRPRSCGALLLLGPGLQRGLAHRVLGQGLAEVPAVQGTVSSRAAAAAHWLGACCVPGTVHYRLMLMPAPCARMVTPTCPRGHWDSGCYDLTQGHAAKEGLSQASNPGVPRPCLMPPCSCLLPAPRPGPARHHV